MMRWLLIILCHVLYLGWATAFSSSHLPLLSASHNAGAEDSSFHQRTHSRINLASRRDGADYETKKRKRKCNPCPEPDDDPEMDRREAAFALLGTLWSAGVVPSAVLGSLSGSARFPETAHAAQGDAANIALPNPIERITDRATKQCLVESLGNRECLVYLDPSNKLYQGADGQVLLQRMEKASAALATIPDLIEKKSWSKVVSVLTGPMGSLGDTMNLLIKSSGHSAKAVELAKKVKTDLYAIAAAVDKKQREKALESHKLATEHLVAFVESLP